MVLGTPVAAGMFGTPGLWRAAILGVLLSPTDAGLGQAVVTILFLVVGVDFAVL
jgi:hypothetical protein